MNKIMVTYDLCGSNKNYSDLIDCLNGYPVCVKINKSSWLINTACDCVTVRDQLCKFIDKDDYLFVAKLTGEAAWHNVEDGHDKVKSAL